MDEPGGSADGPGERRIESWEDIIEDWDWINDDDGDADGDVAAPPVSQADRSALWQRFALADAVTPLYNAIRSAMSQPTMDFEWQYQECYPAFAEASATLDRELERIESAGNDVAPIIDELRSAVQRQRGVVAGYFEEHTDRHQRYREAMVPVRQQILEDTRRAFEEQHELQRRTNQEIIRGQADLHRKRVEAFDDWNREWLRNHRR